MKVLIGGGTGFIGSHLYKHLVTKGYEVTMISRHPADGIITWQDLHRHGLPPGLTAVVNLAGHNLMSSTRRFEDMKGVVSSSRIDTTRQLAEAIQTCDKPPKVWISASAIGYYPPSETAKYTEDSLCKPVDFLSQLCVDWERAAKLAASVSVRHVTVRIGVVLGRDGGAVQQMFMPFFFGVGGKLGSGKQWFPWAVTLTDQMSMIRMFSSHSCQG
ncbi:Epimerase family protein SDR39U1 [Lamellibrachia satsuma]|nr:Epimerase family protein SDR39U1 [Lamellibrachia satsuma]